MKIILLILLLLISIRLTAPSAKSLVIFEAKKINPFEAILKACIQLESQGDRFAYNERENACGVLQIRSVRLNDYFLKTGIRYSLADCFNVEISKQIFLYYCEGDYEKICRNWAGGPKGMSKKSTLEYWKRIKAIL